MPILENYPGSAGSHARTASLANILGQAGVVNPATGEPWTEAMLLGVSGGLGCCYILWEFKRHETACLVLGFDYRSNYSQEVLQQTAERVGASATWRETGGAKTAERHLTEALDAGKTPLAWADPYHLPYRGLPTHLEGCGIAFANICGREGADFLVHDQGMFQLTADQLKTARARVGSYKNRLLLVDRAQPVDTAASVRAGIRDQVDFLSKPSTSFSIPAVAKWAKMMTDPKNKKSWRKVFAQGAGLYSTLVSVYTGIQHDGAGGLRHLYAEFLEQADPLLDEDLSQARDAYRRAGDAWARVAQTAVADFPDARDLYDRRQELLRAGDPVGLRAVHEELEKIRPQRDRAFTEPNGLFDQLQAQLNDVVSAEKEALALLRDLQI